MTFKGNTLIELQPSAIIDTPGTYQASKQWLSANKVT